MAAKRYATFQCSKLWGISVAGKIFLRRLVALLLSLLVPALALAQTETKQQPVPTVLQQAVEKQGVTVLKQFDAGNGITGFVVEQKDQFQIFYSDASGNTFGGPMYADNGVNLTAAHYQQHVPRINVRELLEETRYISTQPNKPSERPVYVFYEPYCGYCSSFYAAAEPYVRAGAEVRWIPVAFLVPQSAPGKPSSMELFAEIIHSPTPLDALHRYEMFRAGAKSRQPLKGFQPNGLDIDIARDNQRIMNRLGFKGTPAVIYFGEDGRAIPVKGFPRMEQLPTVFGMKRMDSNDPRLRRYGAQPGNYPAA